MTGANDAFGIDHPLIVVRDLDAAAARLVRLGFIATPRGRHPWGTHNRLCLFPGGLIELMALEEPALVESNPVDHGLFGGIIRDFLAGAPGREGVAMVALHSRDIEADVAAARRNGVDIAAMIDFRRPLRLPDGSEDEAVVALAMLPDRAHPQLSAFLCMQRKRALVEVPAWRDHPNGAARFAGWIVLGDGEGAARARLSRFWASVPPRRGARATFVTAGGFVDVVEAADFGGRFPGFSPSADMLARAPGVVGISVKVASLAAAAQFCRAVPEAVVLEDRILVGPAFVGDTLIELVE